MPLSFCVTLLCLSCFVYSFSSPTNLSLANITFIGIDSGDWSGISVSTAGDFNNDGFDDILIGAFQAGPNGNTQAGETYLIFGTNQPFSSHFNLSSTSGTKGIIFNGIDVNDNSGYSVSSAGDFNNDGFDDILIGAYGADPNGIGNAGETYLIFGTSQSFGSQFNLSSIDGTNGIMFNGIDSNDWSGYSVSSAGDFNNDGYADILIGAYSADPNGNSGAGETYLIFGTNSISTQFNLSSINGTNGIIFNGIDPSDQSGYSVSSAGDFNNDGFDDIVIGAYNAAPNGIGNAGETYLIFGTSQSFGSQFNLSSINGTNGIQFNGIDAGDSSGFSISSAGDFNNDGFDEILIGAWGADPNGNFNAGETYLIFGTNQSFGSQFNISSINGTNGIIFNGIDASDNSGYSVSSAGDFNNDGFADILISTPYADPNGNSNAGESNLIFGTNQSLDSQFNLSSINGTNGIIFNGIDSLDKSGYSVSSAGDFNNDGYADILIGAYSADPNGVSDAGETYLILHQSPPSNENEEDTVSAATFHTFTNTTFNGIDPNDYSGFQVSSAGDFNNDGFDDILISASYADPNGNSGSGETYLIFGSNQPLGSQFNLTSLDGTNGIIFNGIDTNDYSGASVSSAGDFNNDGFDDILIGAYQADPNGNSNAGETYLIFGTNQPLGSQFDLSSINGTNGIIFNGIDASDQSGFSVSSAGDFNNDGFDDILIGAPFADPNGNSSAGETYLIFGTNQPFSSQFNLSSINGTNGIVFNGIDASDQSGYSVSSAGDFNNDGFDDILIGALFADTNGVTAAGETYLILHEPPSSNEKEEEGSVSVAIFHTVSCLIMCLLVLFQV